MVVETRTTPIFSATIERDALVKALAPLVKCTAKGRSALPVLNNVLLAAHRGRLDLATTNLEQYATAAIACDDDAYGGLTVPAKELLDAVKRVPGAVQLDAETLESGQIRLTVIAGGYSATLYGIDADEFPLLPVVGFDMDSRTGIGLTAGQLATLIHGVTPAASVNDNRMTFNGVYLSADEAGVMEAVATDGYRLARYRFTPHGYGPDDAVTALVPADCFRLLGKMLPAKLPAAELYIDVPGRFAHVVAGGLTVSTRLIDGSFIKYRQVIPTTHTTDYVVARLALIQAVEAVRPGRAGTDVVRLSVTGPAALLVRGGFKDVDGETTRQGVLPAAISGPSVDPCLSAPMLLDALRGAQTDTVTLELSPDKGYGGGTKWPCAVTIRPTGDADLSWLMMPMSAPR